MRENKDFDLLFPVFVFLVLISRSVLAFVFISSDIIGFFEHSSFSSVKLLSSTPKAAANDRLRQPTVLCSFSFTKDALRCFGMLCVLMGVSPIY